MWRTILFFFSCVFITNPNTLSAQLVQGKVVAEHNQEQLAYVQIGVLHKSAGTLTDEEGFFSFRYRTYEENDTLVFSYLGYQTEKVSIKQFRENMSITISLQKEVYALPDVNISATEFTKLKKYGYPKTTAKRLTTGWSSGGRKGTGPIGERGTIIKIKKQPALIKNFHFHIAENGYDSVRFRIHLYTIKDGLPDKELTKSNIFVTTNKKHGWIVVPLSELEMIVNEDVIASVEWVGRWIEEQIIEEPIPLLLSMGFLGNIIHREFGHNNSWGVSKIGHPGIFLEVKVK